MECVDCSGSGLASPCSSWPARSRSCSALSSHRPGQVDVWVVGARHRTARRLVDVFGVRRPDLHRVLLDAVEDGVVRSRRDVRRLRSTRRRRAGALSELARRARRRGADWGGRIALDNLRLAALPGARNRAAGTTGTSAGRRSARVDTDLVPVSLFRVIWGRGARFLFYRIGPEEVYWEGTFAAAAGGGEAVEGAQAGHAQTLPGLALSIETIIAATDTWRSLAPTSTRPPSKQWGGGRVTLVGDAASTPMTNALGEGANQLGDRGFARARSLSRRSS